MRRPPPSSPSVPGPPEMGVASPGSPEVGVETFSLIHKAVVHRNVERIEKLVTISPPSLEAKTDDKLKLTPLVLAAIHGYVDIFHLLVKLGAKTQGKSARGLNTLQHALINDRYQLVSSLLQHPKFTVLRDVFATVESSDTLNIHELANCLRVLNRLLTQHFVPLCRHDNDTKERAELDTRREHYEDIIKSEGRMERLIVLMEGCLGGPDKGAMLTSAGGQDKAAMLTPAGGQDKAAMLTHVAPLLAQILEHLCHSPCLREYMVNSRVPELLVLLMEHTSSSECVRALIDVGEAMMDQGAATRMLTLHVCRACLGAVIRISDAEVTLAAVISLLHCVERRETAENMREDGILEELVGMLRGRGVPARIKSKLIQIFIKIAAIDEGFRLVVLEVGAVEAVLTNLSKKSKLIMVGVDLLRVMCVLKGDAEVIVRRSKSAISTLVHVIQHSIDSDQQHKAFKILWLIISSGDAHKRRSLAGLMGPAGLIMMLDGANEEDTLAATTALCLVAPALYGHQEDIVSHGATPLLLQAAQSASPATQLQALQTLEHLSHDVSFRCVTSMQEAFVKEGGLRLLLNLQTDSVHVRLQALCTLTSVSIGSCQIKRLILNDPSVLCTLVHLLRSLDSVTETRHLLLVARSLCYLGYNSLLVQRTILAHSPLPLGPYRSLMHLVGGGGGGARTSTEAAFHVIVLARTFREREHEVEIVAKCILYLVHTLRSALEGGDKELQVHVCSLVSALLHMRAGICHAFLAVDIVSLLVSVISSSDLLCKKTAAIALSYITKDRKGSRVVLNSCRKEAELYDTIVQHCRGYTIDQDLVERWSRYKTVYISPRKASQNPTAKREEDGCGVGVAGPHPHQALLHASLTSMSSSESLTGSDDTAAGTSSLKLPAINAMATAAAAIAMNLKLLGIEDGKKSKRRKL